MTPDTPGGEGRRRSLARALSRIADASVEDILAMVDAAPARAAWRIGVTGAPGAGKSTLIARIAKARLDRLPNSAPGEPTERVAVLAVDPSSPVTHGAILGDRVRMDAVSHDPRLYVRSLASRGGHDGMAHNIVDLLALADAHGFAEVILETVGVGQAEHGVRRLVDSLVLVLHPEAGDSIQAMKSGIMELADVYAVNKADLPGAARTATELRAVLRAAHGAARGGWSPPVIEVSRGEEAGMVKLVDALEAHRAHARARSDGDVALGLDRRRYHLQSLVQRRLDELIEERPGMLGAPTPRERYEALVAALASDPRPRPSAEG